MAGTASASSISTLEDLFREAEPPEPQPRVDSSQPANSFRGTAFGVCSGALGLRRNENCSGCGGQAHRREIFDAA